jgi:hypothetical protein
MQVVDVENIEFEVGHRDAARKGNDRCGHDPQSDSSHHHLSPFMIARVWACMFPIFVSRHGDDRCAAHVFTKQNWFQGKCDKAGAIRPRAQRERPRIKRGPS